MLGKRNLLALSAAVSLIALGSPSYALDFDSLLRNYLGTRYPGTTIDNQAEIKTTINNRQAQVEQEIEAGARSGQLTTAEEQELRNQLNHVAFLEGSYLTDGNLTPQEISTMVEELTNTSRKLQTYISNSAVTGYAAAVHPGDDPGNRYGYGYGYGFGSGYRDMLGRYGGRRDGQTAATNQAAIKAIIDTKQAELDSRIQTGLANGSLTLNDVHALRTELQKVQNNETTFLADGSLSYSEEKQLTDQLANVDSLIQSHTARWTANRGRYGRNRTSRTSTVAGYRSLLRQRIETGISSGRLTRTEASRLRQMESQTADLERRLRMSGNRLSYQEERRLLAQLDRLNTRINRELNDKQIW